MTGAVISLIVDEKILKPLTSGGKFPSLKMRGGGQNFPKGGKTCTFLLSCDDFAFPSLHFYSSLLAPVAIVIFPGIFTTL